MAQVHDQGAIADRDLVSQLSRKSFASRTIAEQKYIVQQQWPMPKLQLQTRSEGEFFKQIDGIKGRNGCVGVKVWRGFSVGHVNYLGRVSPIHGQRQVIPTCRVYVGLCMYCMILPKIRIRKI